MSRFWKRSNRGLPWEVQPWYISFLMSSPSLCIGSQPSLVSCTFRWSLWDSQECPWWRSKSLSSDHLSLAPECDICVDFAMHEYLNIFVSRKLYKRIFEYIHMKFLTQINIRIYLYQQIYTNKYPKMFIQIFYTNECPNKYLYWKLYKYPIMVFSFFLTCFAIVCQTCFCWSPSRWVETSGGPPRVAKRALNKLNVGLRREILGI